GVPDPRGTGPAGPWDHGARRPRPAALDRACGAPKATPRSVPRRPGRGGGAGRWDGPGQFAGGEPQQPAPQLLLPAATPRPGLLGPAAILPEPPASGAK